MGVLRDFIQSLAPSGGAVDAFLSGRDKALDHEQGVADLTYRRSLNERAKLDNQAAAAEFEDYQKTRELSNQNKMAKLAQDTVDTYVELGSYQQALESARESGYADIPADAQAKLIDRDGLQVVGWESASTGQSGELGKASRDSVRRYNDNEAAARNRHRREIELIKLRQAGDIAKAEAKGQQKKSTTRKLIFSPAKKEQVEAMKSLFESTEVEDKFDKGDKISIGKNLVGDDDSIGSIYRFTADAIATVEGLYEDQRIPFIPGIMQKKLMQHLLDRGVFQQEEATIPGVGTGLSGVGFDSNVKPDPDALATAVQEFVTIEKYRSDIDALKSEFPELRNIPDAEIARQIEAGELE